MILILPYLKNKKFKNLGENIVKQPQKQGDENRNRNDDQGKNECLPSGRPADMFHLTFGVFDVIDDPFHQVLKNALSGTSL